MTYYGASLPIKLAGIKRCRGLEGKEKLGGLGIEGACHTGYHGAK